MTVQVQHFDVIVIGGGPAGMSAALWCADLGLRVELIEQKTEPGGQLLSTFGAIENYLGVRTSNGRELRDLFAQQLEGRDVTRSFGNNIESVDLRAKTVDLADGRRIIGRSIVLATGVRRRSLDVPGEAEFVGKGILDSGQKARQKVAGKRVIIVGGGDAALENALILSDTATNVAVVHRRDRFTARSEFVTDASRRPNVEFLFGTRITGIVGEGSVQAVEVISGDGPAQLDCEYVLIRIGVEPNVDLFKGAIDLDERGYIRVNADCSTNVEGVYAAGDVACSVSPTIATAVGMGATAAKSITALLSKGRG